MPTPPVKPLATRERLSEVRYEIRGELARRARELEAQGQKLIKLNIGNPGAFGFRAPEHLQRAIADDMGRTDPYTHQQGLPSARDAIASVQVDPRLPVIPVRALKNKGTEEFTAKQVEVAKLLDEGKVDMGQAQLEIEHFWAGALRRAVIDGDVERGSIMAGQSVGMVTREEPVAEIIATLLAECEDALARRRAA